jgi:serine/threonine-protein kinase
VRRRFEIAVSENVKVAFFVVNFVMISAVIVLLIVYFIDQLADARAAIADLRIEVQHARKLGQYTLVEKLGEGGMGAVYRARHSMLRRPTALKLIRPDKADPATINRFEREVQLTATLTHPNTVTIYDYGRTEDGTFYYVMEFLEGADLGVIVKLTGPMLPQRAVHVLIQVAQALAEAHKKGLIHRDIKPANVLLTYTHVPDVVKVVDFGLVKDLRAEPSEMTAQQGVLTGTPTFMSPEAIARPETVDARSDVYSLGCLAYYLLTASPVFNAATTIEICSQHLHAVPTPISVKSKREVPKTLEALVLRCLSKNPDERPTSSEVVAQLQAMANEPWGRWHESDAAVWWRSHAEKLAELRTRSIEPIDETVVARAPTAPKA